MKKILLIVTILTAFLYLFGDVGFSFWDDGYEIQYCNNGECGLEQGVGAIEKVNALESDDKFSVYIQRVIKYILSFLALLAVILIIYAGFNILTGIGDEEKMKKSKTIIFYSILGLIVIFIAYPLVAFIIEILNN